VKYAKESYSAWFAGDCNVMCGWKGAQSASRSFVTASVKRHVDDTGHETAVIRTTSVHYRLLPVASTDPSADPT
jgi:hypothetical protein